MNKPTKIALGLAVLAVAALGAAGCGKGPGKTAKNRPDRQVRRQRLSGRFDVLQKGRAPGGAGGVAKLLADLASGDMVLAWRAEEALADLGEDVAPQVRVMLDSASPEARAAACRLAYRFKDIAALPKMIALLTNESHLVRVEAGVNLCGLTDQDFNYRPDSLPADRAAAQARWRNWFKRTYGVQNRQRGARR